MEKVWVLQCAQASVRTTVSDDCDYGSVYRSRPQEPESVVKQAESACAMHGFGPGRAAQCFHGSGHMHLYRTGAQVQGFGYFLVCTPVRHSLQNFSLSQRELG